MTNLFKIVLIVCVLLFINPCSASRVDINESSSESVRLKNINYTSHQKLIKHKNENFISLKYLHYRPVEYETQKVQENEN